MWHELKESGKTELSEEEEKMLHGRLSKNERRVRRAALAGKWLCASRRKLEATH